MPVEEIEKILEPKRLVRIFGKIFLAIILFFALIVGVKIAINTMNRIEATSHDHTWFKSQIEEINSLELRISETRQALTDHKKEIDSRWISRQDDRNQTQKLTENLISLQENRAELIKEYNIAADLAPESVLETLPPNLMLRETPDNLNQ